MSGVVVLGAGHADAASSGGVAIQKIKSRKAPANGVAEFEPHAVAVGNTQITKKTLTVKQHGETIRRNKPYVFLSPGRYKVTQRITSRTVTTRNVNVTVFSKGSSFGSYLPTESIENCVVTSVAQDEVHFDVLCDASAQVSTTDPWHQWKVTASGTWSPSEGTYAVDGSFPVIDYSTVPPEVGQSLLISEITLQDDLAVPQTQVLYGKPITTSKAQTLVVKKGPRTPPPRTCATYSDYKNVTVDYDDPEDLGDSKSLVAEVLGNSGHQVHSYALGGTVFTQRSYQTCAKGASLKVTFQDGYALAKSYSK